MGSGVGSNLVKVVDPFFVGGSPSVKGGVGVGTVARKTKDIYLRKQMRSLEYVRLSMSQTGRHRLKKVRRTQGPSKYTIVHGL